MVNIFSPLDTHISLFAFALAVDPMAEPTLREVLADIKNGRYKDIVERLRLQKSQGNESAYEEGKKMLPGFTLSARLKTRDKHVPLPEKLIAHTHLLQIDIDEVPGQIAFFEARLRNDPMILFCFRSPSGEALKIGIRIDGTRHHDSYLSAGRYFLNKYQVKIDPKVKEVSRLCFVSYDPNPFINEKAGILPITPQPIAAVGVPVSSMVHPQNRKLTHGERALDTARKMIDRSIDGEKLNELIKASKLLGGYVAGNMLSRSDADTCLRSAIESKPGVNNLNTAYKAIATGLDYGEQAPFDFEDLERERLQYSRHKYGPSPDNSGYMTSARSVISVTDVTGVTENPENLAKSVEDWLEFCDGIFTFRELAQELLLSGRKYESLNPQKLNNLKQIIKRLIDKNQLVKVGDKKGVYRKVEKDLEEMKWWEDEDSGEFDISLPLGLTDLCRIFPRNIIIIAGSKDSGKTCLSLNAARANFGKMDIHYFTSEMHKAEIKDRLARFGGNIMDWRQMHIYDKDRNFQDYIGRFPDALTIIDFLEIHDEFWKVGATIRAIYDSLRNGCAIINLQKAAAAEFARGGEITIEKARLYVSLSRLWDSYGTPYTRAKLLSVKAPRDVLKKPGGMIRDYRINYGWQIDPISEWYRDTSTAKRR